MRILFATKQKHLPQTTGGSESSTHDLCTALINRGHDCAVMAELVHGDMVWLRNRITSKITGRQFVQDRLPGYPVYRGWHVERHAGEVVEEFKPDVIVVQAILPILVANSFVKLGCKTVVYARDVLFDNYGGLPDSSKNLRFIANSSFTARQVSERFDVPVTSIPPLVHADKYQVDRAGQYVLFINPCAMKGVEIALALAKLNPDIPFLFVESWRHRDAHIRARAKALGNVVWLKKSPDMKKIYAQAKVLLVPTVIAEAWGRVVTEAQVSGIPVLASNSGGLPESVGPGGLLLDPAGPVEAWNQALRKMWADEGFHASLSNEAKTWSMRPEIQPDYLLTKFLDILQQW